MNKLQLFSPNFHILKSMYNSINTNIEKQILTRTLKHINKYLIIQLFKENKQKKSRDIQSFKINKYSILFK